MFLDLVRGKQNTFILKRAVKYSLSFLVVKNLNYICIQIVKYDKIMM
nr:MAG TPA: hypothetical protein [Caudoviricetes sp.]